MNRITLRLRAFGSFLYDFVVGDDWRIALGVVAALAAVYGLHRGAGVGAWWLLPLTVAAVLGFSLWRPIRKSRVTMVRPAVAPSAATTHRRQPQGGTNATSQTPGDQDPTSATAAPPPGP